MSNGITILAFAIGAAVGSVVTWSVLKNRFEQRAQEEIESVKAAFSKAYGDDEHEEHDISEEAEALMSDLGYRSTNEEKEDEKDMTDGISVVSPDEFADDPDYECVTLFYYHRDKVLAYENDTPIDDPEELVGPDALGSFGEYEDDSVFVKNDNTKTYYEILLSDKDFDDVVKGV